jgi:hypothetical protein
LIRRLQASRCLKRSKKSSLRWVAACFFVFNGTLNAMPTQPAASSSSEGASIQVLLADAKGSILDLNRSYASISRGLPGDLAVMTGHLSETLDAQSLRFILCGPSSALPASVGILSLRRKGDKLDFLGNVPLQSRSVPNVATSAPACGQTPLIRVTADALDANAPGLRTRSIEGELGGSLQVQVHKKAIAALPIKGPREPEFAAAPFLAKLRLRIVRSFAGGPPPMGRDDSDAVSILQQEVRVASQLWGQCGIYFGDESSLDIALVDPPEPFLIAVGCDFGLPASGGQINLLVDDRRLSLPTHRREPPRLVALHLAELGERLGFRAEIEKNAQIMSGALPTFDVSFRRASGERARLRPMPDRRLNTDASLGLCVGTVDLSDGLEHFTNVDSMTGTLEERSLLRAVVDHDPSTIDIVVVDTFSRVGRIGESFVSSEGGSLGNLILLNRAGLREAGRSFALAHELGHILLDYAGHPDDYGVDTPWSLMDSDAVDGTIFGPRHLTLEDCRRALRQSGPGSPLVLLHPG